MEVLRAFHCAVEGQVGEFGSALQDVLLEVACEDEKQRENNACGVNCFKSILSTENAVLSRTSRRTRGGMRS